MPLALLILMAALLLAGCASSPTTSPSTVGPTAGGLTGPEQRYVAAVTAAVPGAPGKWSDATLVKAGYAACTSLNADGSNPEAAVAAARSDNIDDAAARVIVHTAVADLCPAASAAGLSPTAPASAPAMGAATAPSEGITRAKPAKYLYKVFGNYRATQLQYTASNGDMVDLNNTGNINTAGSALPWTGEAAPEPNGNPNVLSASTLSAKGDSYITCTITDDQGDVVATDTGRGAYASCYASTSI